MDSFNDWMSKTRAAASHLCVDGGLYAGVDGCRRFARECAPAILDFEDGFKNISATYSGICVIAYDLRPPVDAKQWLGWIREKLGEEAEKRARESDDYWAVGRDKRTGFIKAVSQGGYDFAKRTAAYYRSVGYSGVVMNELEFKEAQERDEEARKEGANNG